MVKSCLVCDKKYKKAPHMGYTQWNMSKFCSRKCFFERTGGKIKRNCLTCQKEFLVNPFKIKVGRDKYCSKQCYSKRNGENVKVSCEFCQKEFYSYPCEIKNGKGKLCSRKCNYQSKVGIERSEETKRKLRKKSREYMLNNPRNSEFYRKIGLRGLLQQQNFKKPTSIEKKVYAELKARGLLFEKQYLINGKFLVDAYIPSLNLVIEADGDYWHNLPKVVKKDKKENAYLTKCGFELLRLPEKEIKNGEFTERLDNFLSN